MNYFDISIVIIIALFTIRGFFRGLITELMILVSIILGFIIAITYLDVCIQFLLKIFPSLPVFAARILSFILIFLIINITIRLICKALNNFASFTFLQSINHLAGALFGFGKIVILISIVFILIEFIPRSDYFLNLLGTDESLFYQPVKNFAPGLYNLVTSIFPGNQNLQERIMNTLSEADSTAKQFIKP